MQETEGSRKYYWMNWTITFFVVICKSYNKRFDDGKIELFDHKNDPNQVINLASDGEHFNIIDYFIKRMEQLLLELNFPDSIQPD